jgi:hypothetical protein
MYVAEVPLKLIVSFDFVKWRTVKEVKKLKRKLQWYK